MSKLAEGEQLFASFRSSAEKGDIQKAKSLLTQLKILMTTFDSLPPMGAEGPNAARERTLARDVMEVAVFLSAREGDSDAFQRHMAQLKPLCMDFVSQLPPSPNQSAVLGLNLLFLLVENRLAEFHSELELMGDAERASECVMFPVRLEQFLMVGSYDQQVLAARDHVPHEYYKYFLESLLDTVRDGIAECSEAAYSELSIAEAQKMLRMDQRSELEAFVADKYPEWELTADKIIFKAPEACKKSAEIPSMRLIAECLSYATELERIV
ncbi:unnamed protein product [Ectocarpus sp. 12 AP-2014]